MWASGHSSLTPWWKGGPGVWVTFAICQLIAMEKSLNLSEPQSLQLLNGEIVPYLFISVARRAEWVEDWMSERPDSKEEIPFCYSLPSPDSFLLFLSLPPAHQLINNNIHGCLRILVFLFWGYNSIREAPPEDIFLNNCMWSGFEIVARRKKVSDIKMWGGKGLILLEQR